MVCYSTLVKQRLAFASHAGALILRKRTKTFRNHLELPAPVQPPQRSRLKNQKKNLADQTAVRIVFAGVRCLQCTAAPWAPIEPEVGAGPAEARPGRGRPLFAPGKHRRLSKRSRPTPRTGKPSARPMLAQNAQVQSCASGRTSSKKNRVIHFSSQKDAIWRRHVIRCIGETIDRERGANHLLGHRGSSTVSHQQTQRIGYIFPIGWLVIGLHNVLSHRTFFSRSWVENFQILYGLSHRFRDGSESTESRQTCSADPGRMGLQRILDYGGPADRLPHRAQTNRPFRHQIHKSSKSIIVKRITQFS